MAFDAKRINPIDLQPRVAVGVDIPFSGKGVFNSTFQTVDAVKANLINIITRSTYHKHLGSISIKSKTGRKSLLTTHTKAIYKACC